MKKTLILCNHLGETTKLNGITTSTASTIERRLVGEDRVGRDASHGLASELKHGFFVGVHGDHLERVAEKRNEHREEKRIAHDGIDDHQWRTEGEREAPCFIEAEVRASEPDLEHKP